MATSPPPQLGNFGCASLRRSVKLAVDPSSSCHLPQLKKEWGAAPGGIVMAFENYSGRIDTVVDAGIKVTEFEFFPDILDVRYRANGCTASPILPQYAPPSGHGPSELDFEIYASMSMEGYEAPPPPRAPLGGVPFEDYYDEHVGVDHISKEDMPTSSLLQFLDSLSAKKGEEGSSYGKNPWKRQTRRTSSSGEGGPSFTDSTPLMAESHGMEVQGISHVGIVDEQSISHVRNIDEPMMQAKDLPSPKPKQALDNGKLVYAHTSATQVLRNSSSATQVSRNSSSSIGGTGESRSSQVEQSDTPSFFNYHQTRSSAEEFQAFSPTMPIQESMNVETMSASTWLTRDLGTLNRMSTQSRPNYQPNEKSEKEKVCGKEHNESEETTTPRNASEDACPQEASESGRECRVRVASIVTGTDIAVGGMEDEARSPFYEPREGDIILGAITFANDKKVELEIGAELTALMPLRELRPFPHNSETEYFELPPASTDSSYLPWGKSLLLGEKVAVDGGVVGTIVVAEVTGRTVSDRRAVLSCRAPGQRMAWHRIHQLMWLGEAIQFEVLQWNEGGLLGFLEGIRAFLPKSELVQRPPSMSRLKSYVGRVLHVAIVQADRQASNAILSESMAWKIKHLQLGTVHDVTVTKVHSYGMQVEIDNTSIRGFVHISNFTNDYISSVSNFFVEGDKARVMLIKGRNPSQISFGFTNLEKESGLLLRDKEQVFHDVDEMAHRFREALSEQERENFSKARMVNTSCPVYQEPTIVNWVWLS